MIAIMRVDEGSLSLEERLELHAGRLVSKLATQPSTEEIEIEVSTLNELVNEFKKRDELLERLLDRTTPDSEVRQIVEDLPEPSRSVVDDRNELNRLHSESHHLIEHSVLLITGAKRLVDQAKYQTSRYALEVCGFCSGFGGNKDGPCAACCGNRCVLVHQPSIKCPRCKGTGKQDGSDPSLKYFKLCTVCRGLGWAFGTANRRAQAG